MKLRTLILALSVAALIWIRPAMADKSYRVTISTAATAGSAQLQAGDYKMILDASRVRFTHLFTGKEVEVAAKIDDSAERKFDNTLIHWRKVESGSAISEICLRGTKTRVVFE
jgi:hypothetical protein